MLKKLAFAAALSTLGTLSAQALPAAPMQSIADALVGEVEFVAGGCGAAFYRDRHGICRPKRAHSGAVVVIPPVVVAPIVRPCPPGMWRNRRGRCVY